MAPPTTEREPVAATNQRTGTDRDDLVGRDEAIEVLHEMLRQAQVVVLCGPPGVGKSRLAAEYVARTRGEASGSWLRVDLRGASADEWRGRIAASVGVEFPDNAGFAQLIAALDARGCAGLVLDGAEVLSGQAALFEQIRFNNTSARLLVTSRQRFGRAGLEHLRLEGLDGADAVALFCRHARQGAEQAERAVIARLVERLDGLPRAVELAAEATDLMSPQMILDRLDRQFEIFGASGGDEPSFEQAIAESWRRLDEAQKTCLRHCSVFAESFSLEAAEQVVELPESSGALGAIEVLRRLIDASWLRSERTAAGQTRFRLWKSLRVFARHKLDTADETAAVMARYVGVCRRRGLQLAEAVMTPEGVDAIERLRLEQPDLVEAVDHCLEREPRAAAELLWALRWSVRHDDGGAESSDIGLGARLERVCALLEGTGAAAWVVRLTMLHGELALRMGRHDRASELLERAQQLANRGAGAGLRARVSRAASMALAHVDIDAAEQRLREALELATSARDPLVEGRIRERLGFVQLQTFRLEEARQSFRRARTLLTTHANALLAAPATTGLAYVALRTGHRTGAASAFEETVRIFAAARDRRREAEARFNLAVALHADAELDRACEHYERALELWERIEEPRYEAIARTRLGLVLAELGAPRAAMQSLKEAVACGQATGDWHNRAIAEACRGMLGLVQEGPGAPIDELERAVEEMKFAGDPDAAAAAFCVLSVLHAARRQPQPAGDALRRLGALRTLLASQDTSLGRVIDALSRLAGQWTHELFEAAGVAFAPKGLEQPRPEDLLHYVPSLDDDPQAALAEASRLSSPYVRLLFAGFIAQRRSSAGSMQRLTHVSPEEARGELVIHRQGHWFQIDGEPPVDLLSRQPLRRMLAAIITSHLEDVNPGQSVAQLIEKGWPDEILTKSAGSNRVYTGIRGLRDLGLESILVTDDAGYRFAEDIVVKMTEASSDQSD